MWFMDMQSCSYYWSVSNEGHICATPYYLNSNMCGVSYIFFQVFDSNIWSDILKNIEFRVTLVDLQSARVELLEQRLSLEEMGVHLNFPRSLRKCQLMCLGYRMLCRAFSESRSQLFNILIFDSLCYVCIVDKKIYFEVNYSYIQKIYLRQKFSKDGFFKN